jgi:hypothetical protein
MSAAPGNINGCSYYSKNDPDQSTPKVNSLHLVGKSKSKRCFRVFSTRSASKKKKNG